MLHDVIFSFCWNILLCQFCSDRFASVFYFCSICAVCLIFVFESCKSRENNAKFFWQMVVSTRLFACWNQLYLFKISRFFLFREISSHVTNVDTKTYFFCLSKINSCKWSSQSGQLTQKHDSYRGDVVDQMKNNCIRLLGEISFVFSETQLWHLCLRAICSFYCLSECHWCNFQSDQSDKYFLNSRWPVYRFVLWCSSLGTFVSLLSNHVRNMSEGNVFSRVCDSVQGWSLWDGQKEGQPFQLEGSHRMNSLPGRTGQEGTLHPPLLQSRLGRTPSYQGWLGDAPGPAPLPAQEE